MVSLREFLGRAPGCGGAFSPRRAPRACAPVFSRCRAGSSRAVARRVVGPPRLRLLRVSRSALSLRDLSVPALALSSRLPRVAALLVCPAPARAWLARPGPASALSRFDLVCSLAVGSRPCPSPAAGVARRASGLLRHASAASPHRSRAGVVSRFRPRSRCPDRFSVTPGILRALISLNPASGARCTSRAFLARSSSLLGSSRRLSSAGLSGSSSLRASARLRR